MRKWTFLGAFLAVALIGCGGDGDSNGGGGVVGGAGDSRATVSLPNVPGLINLSYLTGQGRAAGDLVGVIRRTAFTDSVGTVEVSSTRNLFLKGFENQIISLNVPMNGQASRQFDTYTLDLLRVEQQTGSATNLTFAAPSNLPMDFDASITVFGGRHTNVPVFLDDAMITVDTSEAFFDEDQFTTVNTTPEAPFIQGYISDYVAFDITGVANRPLLTTNEPASKFLISGDGFAISEVMNDGSEGPFEALTLDETAPLEGRYKGPRTVGGQRTPGTYSLIQLDPSDLAGVAKITSLQGIWRNYTEVISNLGSFEIITFPGADDTDEQDAVAIVRNGSTITNLYFGFANLSSNELRLYPIANIVGASIDGEIIGTLSNLRTADGTITTSATLAREGRFSLSGTLPSGFRTTGRFIVFRR